MASTLDWKSSEDPRDIVHSIVQALVEGRVVALPAETAYHGVVSGLKPEAVAKLLSLKSIRRDCAPTLFLRSASEALDYVPTLSRVAARLVDRGWPGPLVLELPIEPERSLASCLPASVQKAILRDERFLALRVAAHEAIRQAMRLMPGPLVAVPLCDAAGQPVCRGDQLSKVCAGEIGTLIDDGPTHFGDLATSVRVDQNRCQIIHQGVLGGEDLHRLGQLTILLVCTGNTCRSPMAETLLKAKLRERFPGVQGEVAPPVFVTSAGLSAFPGGPASPEAISVMKKRGLSLLDHQSRSVTERGLRQADLVLAMTSSHRLAIIERFPDIADKVYLVSASPQDVSDPFGGSEAVYTACADQIDGCLDHWVEQVEESWFPIWCSN